MEEYVPSRQSEDKQATCQASRRQGFYMHNYTVATLELYVTLGGHVYLDVKLLHVSRFCSKLTCSAVLICSYSTCFHACLHILYIVRD